jgi:hypothetical protein
VAKDIELFSSASSLGSLSVLDASVRAAELAQRQAIANIERLRLYLAGLDVGFYLVINDKDLLTAMETHVGQQKMYSEMILAAKSVFLPRVYDILGEIIIEAADKQNRGAFPEEYLEPILQAIYRLPSPSIAGLSPQNVEVTLPNLQLYLGGYDEYAAAFHHGALKATRDSKGRFKKFTSRRVDVRQEVARTGDLKQKDPRKRYRYFKLLLNGTTTFSVRSRSGKSIDVPVEGSYDETIQARLDAWKKAMPTGAPQWILLEHGQPRWSPTIKVDSIDVGTTKVRNLGLGGITSKFNVSEVISTNPGNISGKWIRALAEEWTGIVTGVWDEQIKQFNKTVIQTPPSPIASRPSVFGAGPEKVESKYRIRSGQYGTVYYDYSEYIRRRLGNLFDLNGQLVQTSKLEIYDPRGKRI